MPAKKSKSDVAVASDLVRHAIETLQDMEERWKHWVINGISEGLGLGSRSTQQGGGGGGTGAGAGTGADGGGAAGGGASNLGTPRAFLRDKSPQGPIQIIACLGQYLTVARNMPHFKSGDLKSLYSEAAYPERIRSWPVAVANAQKAKYLAAGTGHGVKQLSHHGEDVVNALPNQEAVLALKAAGRQRRDSRRRKPSGRKARS